MKIFFDENFSHHLSNGLSSFQAGRRSEGVEALHLKEVYGRGVADEVWIPKVAQV